MARSLSTNLKKCSWLVKPFNRKVILSSYFISSLGAGDRCFFFFLSFFFKEKWNTFPQNVWIHYYQYTHEEDFQFKLKLHRNFINQNFPVSLTLNAFLGNMPVCFDETSDLVFGEVMTLTHTHIYIYIYMWSNDLHSQITKPKDFIVPDLKTLHQSEQMLWHFPYILRAQMGQQQRHWRQTQQPLACDTCSTQK